ncbi:MAG: hypothetical protein ACLGIJ_13880 [Candidatus Limnocylindria bacterium]
MWPPFGRTWHRLVGDRGHRPVADRDAPAIELDPPAEPPFALAEDLTLAIGRTEVQRLADALQALLGPGAERPDTPARLEAALAAAVEQLGGTGRPRVSRRPPGLYTPEAWQVHLGAVGPEVGAAIRTAIRTGRFT